MIDYLLFLKVLAILGFKFLLSPYDSAEFWRRAPTIHHHFYS